LFSALSPYGPNRNRRTIIVSKQIEMIFEIYLHGPNNGCLPGIPAMPEIVLWRERK
jgi:hypothetical protein